MADSRPRQKSKILEDIESARTRLAQLEAELASLPSNSTSSLPTSPSPATSRNGIQPASGSKKEWPLTLREYKRYGRQMLITPVGLPGQLKLKRAHILVVGAGGLGCPVLLYLAAAGVGEITILDHDTVELSNLHRQVLHTESRVGTSKAQSAKIALESLNSDIKINAYEIPFIPSIFHSPETPRSIKTKGTFSLILDCTDNPATRHFLNSYAVAMDVPLVSGGAVRAEGTVGVYGLAIKSPPSSARTVTEERKETSKKDDDKEEEEEVEERGPCYACIFPPPPVPSPSSSPSESTPKTQLEKDLEAQRKSLEGTGACSDEGVLGINCGIVGIGMAAEAVKVLLGIARPTLHLFAPLSPSPYRTIKTRSRKPTCPACGTFSDPTISPASLPSSSIRVSTPQTRWRDFLESKDGQWPGWQDPLCSIPGIGEVEAEEGRNDERWKAKELREMLSSRNEDALERVRIVDTRPEPEFGIVNLEGSVNVPFAKLLKNPALAFNPTASTGPEELTRWTEPETIAFVCRRGNDSLLASRAVRRWLAEEKTKEIRIVDLVGGLTAYSKEEEGFPVY